jgi:ABC-type nitrate/sulfonate/bicarbonate transport system ATPase subunit
MDEAFSALDPGTRREMQEMIHGLWQSLGTTVLFVTHNTHEALRMGSRVVVLAKETPDHGSRVVRESRDSRGVARRSRRARAPSGGSLGRQTAEAIAGAFWREVTRGGGVAGHG